MTRQAIMKWTTVGSTMVTCSTGGRMDDATWTAFAKDLDTRGITRCLQGLTGIVEVSTVQRKLVTDILTAHRIVSVLVTDARVVRGVVTAASWQGANVRAFGWPELKQAIEYIEAVSGNRERITAAVQAMKAACERG